MATQQQHCGHCGIAATISCECCEVMKYCTLECQDADRRLHELLCGREAVPRDRPKPNMRRAILLPESSEKPRFIWLPTSAKDDEELKNASESEGDSEEDEYDEEGEYYYYEMDDDLGVPYSYPNQKVALPDFTGLCGGGDQSIRPSQIVCGKMGSGEVLKRSIWVAYRSNFMYDGSVTNRCASCLTRGRVGDFFKGALILHGMTKVSDPGLCVDLDSSDLTLALEGMLDLRKRAEMGFNPRGVKKERKKTKGVKVTSFPPFSEKVDVPLQHPIFFEGHLSDIGKKIGLPLLTRSYGAGLINPAVSLHSHMSTSTMTNMRDTGTFWGPNTESVLVARADGVSVPVYVVDAACQFSRIAAERLANAHRTSQVEAITADSEITEEKWVEFLLEVIREKKEDGSLVEEESDPFGDKYDDKSDDDESDGDESDDEEDQARYELFKAMMNTVSFPQWK